eukprot:366307-Chlamydomonas_euryale.AAC.12
MVEIVDCSEAFTFPSEPCSAMLRHEHNAPFINHGLVHRRPLTNWRRGRGGRATERANLVATRTSQCLCDITRHSNQGGTLGSDDVCVHEDVTFSKDGQLCNPWVPQGRLWWWHYFSQLSQVDWLHQLIQEICAAAAKRAFDRQA